MESRTTNPWLLAGISILFALVVTLVAFKAAKRQVPEET
jgi:hypothetical protein